VLLASTLVSCGGGGGSPATPVLPTPPPSGWPAGTVLSLVSGETGAPIAGAQVIVAGLPPHVADAAGQATMQTTAAEGATVDVEAAGFLTRQTLVRHSLTRLTLWPDHARLPGSYTKALVYTSSAVGDSTSRVPLERLPPHVRTLALEPSDQLKADPQTMAAHRQAVDYFNAAVQGQVVFAVGGAADLIVPTRIDATYSSCEGRADRLLALTWVSRHEVSRAEIVFCSEKPTHLPTPIAHELGHVFGLRHSADGSDVMCRYYDSGAEHGFTDRETLAMSLLLLRRGGNAWPDNDRTATASGTHFRLFVD